MEKPWKKEQVGERGWDSGFEGGSVWWVMIMRKVLSLLES